MRKLIQAATVAIMLAVGMTVFLTAVGFATTAHADAADAKEARVMWSAFECTQYAAMAGRPEEAEHLFKVGYEAGQRFLSAVRAGSITDEEANSNVPIGVSLRLGGPTDDFVIGRVYEGSTNDAFDKVVTKDAQGWSLDIEDRVRDPELKASIAETKYLQSNCAVF